MVYSSGILVSIPGDPPTLATLILMELLRHAEFDVSRRVILMVSSVTDIANLVQSQDTMRDYFIVTWSHHTNGINISSSLRLRGGMNTGTNPNIRKDLFDIPSLTKARFTYDGLRDVDFIEKILYPLRNGLAQVTWKDATMLATVERTDPGGVLGNPPRAAAPPGIVQISIIRNRMAAGCILNYILPSARIYKLFMRTFNMNGIDIYLFLVAHGPIPRPPRILKAQEDVWQRMTLDNLKLDYTQRGYVLWIECVMEQARLLNKNGNQIKQKLIDGLPAFFNTEKSAMRHNNTFVYPALLGGVLEYAMTSLAANVHPMAGQQDGESLLMSYFPDFMAKASETKQIPRGLVRLIGNDDEVEDDEHDLESAMGRVNLLAKDVHDSMKCHCCGGNAHATVQTTSDGTKIICAKKQLEDLGILSKPEHSTTSANKDTKHYRSRARKYQQQSKALLDQNKMLMQAMQQLEEDQQREQSDQESQASASSLGQTNDDSDESGSDSDASNLSSFDASTFANKVGIKGKKPIFKGKFKPRK